MSKTSPLSEHDCANGNYPAAKIRAAINANLDEMVALRRDVHAHPELGFEEFRTSDIVASRLAGWGIEVNRGLAGTGVVGTIRGNRGAGRSIGLRADMDALSLTEYSEHDHCSTSDGKMHACGHDGHTVMLLTAAHYLAEHRDFAGTVHLIFQPAEEGFGGARKMVEDGLFTRFPVDAVYGLHNYPGIEAGTFAIRSGPTMASSDTWTVSFHGTGGHGGSGAHLATDPTLAAGQFIPAIQAIIGRNVPALEPAVLSVGYIHAGSPAAPNVIPSKVVTRGTARCFSQEVRTLLEHRLRDVAKAVAAANGCTATVEFERRYPPLVNAPDQTRIAAETATAIVGANNVDTKIERNTGGEDFSFMLHERPGALIFLGNGINPDGSFHGLHTPHYDFNDEIIGVGATYWCTLVMRELGSLA